MSNLYNLIITGWSSSIQPKQYDLYLDPLAGKASWEKDLSIAQNLFDELPIEEHILDTNAGKQLS